MNHLIKYRLLSDQLSEKELILFISKLIENGQKELIISGIFSKVHKQIQIDQDVTCIKSMNQDIQSIIRQRKQNTYQNAETQQISRSKHMATMPSSLICEIGSYLKLSILTKFSLSNRRIFVSLRTPYPALQQLLDDRWIQKYYNAHKQHNMPFDFHQFRSLRKLSIDVGDYIQYNIHSLGTLFNKLKGLRICNTTYSNDQDRCRIIFDSNMCHFNNIQRLSIYSPHQSFTAKSYLNIITSSRQLRSLRIYKSAVHTAQFHSNIDILIKPDVIRNKLPHLTAMECRKSSLILYEDILHALSDQIESLHIDEADALMCQDGLPNLNEFCFQGTRTSTTSAINELMKSVKHLKQIYIVILEDDPLQLKLNVTQEENFKRALSTVLSIPSLEKIGLVLLNDKLESEIFNIVTNAVMSKLGREKLCLDIVNISNECLDKNILSLVNALKCWTKDFRLCVWRKIRSIFIDPEIINKIQQICDVVFVNGAKKRNDIKKCEFSTKNAQYFSFKQFGCFRCRLF